MLPASVSDNLGGIAVIDIARAKLGRFKHLWCDAGFKRTFVEHCRHHHIAAVTVARISEPGFHVIPRRWVVERTWSWIMNNRRLQIDYERDPATTKASYGPPTAANSSGASGASHHESRWTNIRESLSELCTQRFWNDLIAEHLVTASPSTPTTRQKPVRIQDSPSILVRPRVRCLLYAGRPDWTLQPTPTLKREEPVCLPINDR